MNIVQVRSPFKIVINQSGQLFTQVKLYIWNKGDAEPIIPTYTFSKAVPSLANRECVFNISNQLQEFIEPVWAILGGIEEESPKSWCLFKVEKFTGTDSKDLALLDTTNYIGLNGFTQYMSGNQLSETADYKTLVNVNDLYTDNNKAYFNLLIDADVVDYSLLYSAYDYEYIINDYFTGIVLLSIPFVLESLEPSLYNQFNITLVDPSIEKGNLFRITSIPTEECKYTPVICTFQNSLGGWQYLTFFKAQTNSITVKGSEFNLLPNETEYNPLIGQTKVFNLNGNQSVKLNTGWVDENYNILIRDLLLSETVLIDNKPAMVKSKSQTYKTQLKDKMINYEIEFDYAFDLINNVL
jgi:hypothetical protein